MKLFVFQIVITVAVSYTTITKGEDSDASAAVQCYYRAAVSDCSFQQSSVYRIVGQSVWMDRFDQYPESLATYEADSCDGYIAMMRCVETYFATNCPQISIDTMKSIEEYDNMMRFIQDTKHNKRCSAILNAADQCYHHASTYCESLSHRAYTYLSRSLVTYMYATPDLHAFLQVFFAESCNAYIAVTHCMQNYYANNCAEISRSEIRGAMSGSFHSTYQTLAEDDKPCSEKFIGEGSTAIECYDRAVISDCSSQQTRAYLSYDQAMFRIPPRKERNRSIQENQTAVTERCQVYVPLMQCIRPYFTANCTNISNDEAKSVPWYHNMISFIEEAAENNNTQCSGLYSANTDLF